MKALEELFVETTLDLLPSLPVRSAKMQLAHWYTQKSKRSRTTAVLRAIVPKTITVPQAKRLVQLGISYQTLQDIRCAFSTYADFGKALADRTTKPTSPRDACGPYSDRELRSHATPHFVYTLYMYFCYQPFFLKATTYPRKSQVCRRAIGFGIRESL